MSDMSLAERHARVRAHDDAETVQSAHQWVVQYFGGDHVRAAWFFDELRDIIETGGRETKFFSVRTGTHRPIHIRNP